jgi:hypothetical protein
VALGALLVAVSLLPALQTKAQEEPTPAPIETPTHPTGLETYLERPGILLVKRHHRLPPVEIQGGGKIRLDAIGAHEPGMQHQRVMGIRIEVDAPGLTPEQRIFYIDVHEIEELAQAIDFMSSAMEEQKPSREGDRTEMSISTRDDLEVGVQFAAGGASPFLRTPSGTFGLQRAGFEDLRANLNQSRKHLFSN